MAFYGKNIGVIPLTDAAGITKGFNWPSHKGLDIGWSEQKWMYCPVLAWQDGIVVQRGYGSEVGNYIVVEHYYDDNTKRWTGYIHLDAFPTVNVGDKVTLGQQMGNARRGNTGQSNGVHLHIYLTKDVEQRVPYTWNTMLANCIDPYPYLYYNKECNYNYIAYTAWKKELRQMKYPEPVKRNEKVNQIEIKSDTRRLRSTPEINSNNIYDEYCKKGIYNVLSMTVKDDYTWALIAEIDGNKFWVAAMDGEYLPKKEIKYPEPVKRDETVYQCEIKSDTRKLRAQPSLQGEEYDELCKRGIYNVLKWQSADGHDWALIAVIDENEFWVAVMAGEDLPITDYKKLYEQQLLVSKKLEIEVDEVSGKLVKARAKLLDIKNLVNEEE